MHIARRKLTSEHLPRSQRQQKWMDAKTYTHVEDDLIIADIPFPHPVHAISEVTSRLLSSTLEQKYKNRIFRPDLLINCSI
jgi:hypothetical protein